MIRECDPWSSKPAVAPTRGAAGDEDLQGVWSSVVGALGTAFATSLEGAAADTRRVVGVRSRLGLHDGRLHPRAVLFSRGVHDHGARDRRTAVDHGAGFTIVLPSSVTAAIRANALPVSVAPVPTVIA
jgi:hypothetical protein